ncbi:acyl-CoA dehydrogenase family protein [Thalassococcus lentus]|uniref:Acyl-CoA dehydrogenase family protein n=1 Tax=Thalassococcus lentus TaxID=1210524 RepID=A0ABT4XXK2_9RHOB|nr:acyl-CoA dehydrogenase family protein [Thalassococcus lentus]MDA7426700.1 acyl-CoA dehydrogenase family protein [Thalassococcus lentus]
MTSFKAPAEDILFSLNHVADAARLDEWDAVIASDILNHFAPFAESVIAPLNAVGDEQGAQLQNGRVRMPEGFGNAFAQLAAGGWQGLAAPEEYGGMGLSSVYGAGVSEIFSGANHALQMVCNLVPGAIATLQRFGSQKQQDTWIPGLADGSVLSTMCLTEPAAGSDLSAIRTTAKPDQDGWVLNGEKIFISGGDQDLSDDILHLVLARSGPADAGIVGLSLFLCRRQPAARVTRLEGKLGLHASPTCQMLFDDAKAELVGEEGAGLKAMFTLMNHARLDVALQGVAHAARAADITASYAAERKQGRGADGATAVLHDHADVRRMIETQRMLELGSRALCHIALVELELGNRPELVEFLTPLCKVLGSEAGIQAADLGIQVLGGYGYLKEYGIEQIWRDARICAIYEGANGIHTRSLATRGLRSGGADGFETLCRELAGHDERVRPTLARWATVKDEIAAAKDATELAHRFYRLTADLALRAVWARIDAVADAHSDARVLKALAAKILNTQEVLM